MTLKPNTEYLVGINYNEVLTTDEDGDLLCGGGHYFLSSANLRILGADVEEVAPKYVPEEGELRRFNTTGNVIEFREGQFHYVTVDDPEPFAATYNENVIALSRKLVAE